MNAPALAPSALPAHLTRVLSQVLRFTQPTESLLRQYFSEHPKLGQRDRACLTAAVYFIIRRKSRIVHCQEHPDASASFLPSSASFLASSASFPPSAHRAQPDLTAEQPVSSLEEFPTWLVAALNRHQSAQETLAELQGLNTVAPLDLRASSRTQRESILRRLQEEGHRAMATPHSPLGVRLVDKPSLRHHPLFDAREVEIQDEGSQLMTLFLGARRGEKVVDFCAGAGGKTLTLMALMRVGQVYATDTDGKRLRRLRERSKVAGEAGQGVLLSLLQLHGEGDERLARWSNKMDRVLVDAPCSGLGMMRRQPDLLWRRRPEEIATFVDRQKRILREAASLVRSGGVLLYGTCSILREENQEVVADFLTHHRNFQRAPAQEAELALRPLLDGIGDLQLRPHHHGTDGFYAARLRKSP